MSDRHERWRRLFERKMRLFKEEHCLGALRISSPEDLEASLLEMSRNYGRSSLPQLLDSFQPSLTHLKSFTNAITSATQYEGVACLVWGGVQAVVEAACLSSAALTDIFDILASLNEELPIFDKYLELFPEEQQLQWVLQALYEEYLDFCIVAIRYMRRNGYVNYLLSFFISTPLQRLQQAKNRIQRHRDKFFKEVELVQSRKGEKSNFQQQETQTKHNQENSTNFVSTVEMFPNYYFVGRDALLKDMHTKLKGSARSIPAPAADNASNGPICFVIHGLAGLGKTQTALEYSHRYKSDYDAIFWLNAERDPDLAASYAKIAVALNLLKRRSFETDSKDLERIMQLEEARKWLENIDKRWLLIFDNVEDIRDLEGYLPMQCRTQGSIIITSQKPGLKRVTEDFYNYNIDDMNAEDGVKLLFKYIDADLDQADPLEHNAHSADHSEDEKSMARELCELVNGLPLAVATIGGYIKESESSLDEFLMNVKKSSKAWEASATGEMKHYPKTLETVFDIALEELDKYSRNARNLINILAFLSPDEIPEDILCASHTDPELTFLNDRAEFTEMLRILRRRQLIKRHKAGSEPYISIHRSLQWSILCNLSKSYDRRWEVFLQAFHLLRKGLPIQSPLQVPEPEKWDRFSRFVPQILTLRTHCLWPEPPIQPPVGFARIMRDMGTYMWHAGLIPSGTTALQTAEEILDDRDVDGADPLRGDIHASLGVLLSFPGVSTRKESLEHRHKALDIRRKEYAEVQESDRTRTHEIRLCNVETDLAIQYCHEEKFEEAEIIFANALKKYKSWDTEERIPFEYSKFYQWSAFIQMYHGNTNTAVNHVQRGADLVAACAGEGNSWTLQAQFFKANILYLVGQLDKSLELNLAVRKKRKRSCGSLNHYTLESYSTCAWLLLEQGNAMKAKYVLCLSTVEKVRVPADSGRKYCEICLERRKRALWHEEGVARAQYRYSVILDRLGEHDEAAKQLGYAQNVIQRYLKDYPDQLPNHPEPLVVLDQMVSMWDGRSTGKLKQRTPPL